MDSNEIYFCISYRDPIEGFITREYAELFSVYLNVGNVSGGISAARAKCRFGIDLQEGRPASRADRELAVVSSSAEVAATLVLERAGDFAPCRTDRMTRR